MKELKELLKRLIKDHERMNQLLEEHINDKKKSGSHLEIMASGDLLENKNELQDLEKKHKRVSEFGLEYERYRLLLCG
ncbi:MAG: hypothetical protein M1812_003102 [Candelaria pacifica]|nr:MAG: hypothetical protein M1812_003102 [Candelaria pacifica]